MSDLMRRLERMPWPVAHNEIITKNLFDPGRISL